jgi:drug/metabolite transporter (DMT)-like permease
MLVGRAAFLEPRVSADGDRHPPWIGIGFAFGAAVLFGASTPFAKLLLGTVDPWLLAGLLYFGSGIGLAAWRVAESRLRGRRIPALGVKPSEVRWLAAAVLAGGVLGPGLLMLGLKSTAAATASLLLNLEGVFTALLAWFVFRENFDRRIALGMVFIAAGGVLLSIGSESDGYRLSLGAAAIIGACFAWALDNNLTRNVSGGDAVWIASLKGLVAGAINLLLATVAGSGWPPMGTALAAGLVGLFGYGVSLTLFVLALRHLGTARTGAYFSIAPFVGALLSLAMLHEPPTGSLMVAGLMMATGVWLHLTERHEHEHFHPELEHSHAHRHDEHHQHEHGPDDPPGDTHTHHHRHPPIVHSHPHFPDIHHRHEH